MVQRLFIFFEASHTRNWLRHLSSAQDLMTDFIAMGRIKYRKAWLIYIAGMKSLEVENPEMWNYFMETNFTVEKSNIPGAIGCNHTCYQVNREDKTHGGLKGITRNQNSRNRHYLAAPVLAQLQEMMNTGLAFSSSQRKHQQLNTHYVHRQGIKVFPQEAPQHIVYSEKNRDKNLR